MKLAKAIKSLCPTAEFTYTNNDYSTVVWFKEPPSIPTEAEITAEVARLQAEYDNNEYQRQRAAAYPSLNDQADMAYWDRQNGTTTLDDAILAVKVAYPKPVGVI